MKLLLASFILLIVSCRADLVGLGASCADDYQCENAPFSFCSDGTASSSSASLSETSHSCHLLPGFGVDAEQSKLYFLGRCDGALPDSGEAVNPGTVHIFSANLDGSSVESVTILSEDTGSTSPDYSTVSRFYDISPYDFIIRRNNRNSIGYYAVDRTSFNETMIAGQRSSPAPTYDFSDSGNTYSCLGFNVVKFSTIVTDSTASSEILYTREQLSNASLVCLDVQVVGDKLYILVGAGASDSPSTVYQGSTDGSAPLQALFNIFDNYPIIEADSRAVYFSDQFSINRYFVDGSVGPSLLYPDHRPSPNFTNIQVEGDFLYFDDGAYIIRTNLNSLASEFLVEASFTYTSSEASNSASAGAVCACRDNFSGSDCASCDGMIQWDNFGHPSCVSTLDNGFPASCQFDWQCGNVPYTVCSASSCQCRENFSGNGCQTCGGEVEWNAGLPSCSASESASASSSSSSSSSADACPGVQVTQTLRTSWPANNQDTAYLYDITVFNGGSTMITSPSFFIRPADPSKVATMVDSWNLVIYAATEPTQRLVSLLPNTQIAPGASYTAAGYIVSGTQTTFSLEICSAE